MRAITPTQPQVFFRADVEGLRAVAVLLVLLYHAGIGRISGGYIGVDVFFVLSGFLITSLLLREADTLGRPSLARFYARRARRLIPLASLVTVTTVVLSYRWLGFIRADQTAEAARWCSAFIGNWYFASLNTSYLDSQQSPSPLQHFWSLAVEEQFYFVWPGLFVAVCLLLPRFSLRRKLAAVVIVVSVASFVWSMIQTASNQNVAYYSSLTRAWEMGAGALLAVGAAQLKRITPTAACVLSWAGLAGIVASAYLLSEASRFPGYVAALPVGATLAAIAGGSVAHAKSASLLLNTAPFQWIGKLSYGLYLWHWPILVIYAEYQEEPQSASVNALLLLGALALSAVTYYLFENPIRHSRVLIRSSRRSLILGAVFTLSSIALATWTLKKHGMI